MPDTPTPAPSLHRRSFWQRYVVDPIIVQLTQGITPEKIALALAVGSACAMFPLLGSATLLCLIVGAVLRLNQPLVQMVNALCTLPHLLAIYLLLRLGNFIFGAPPPRIGVREFIFRAPHAHLNLWTIARAFWSDHGAIFRRLELETFRAVIAWLIVAPIWVALVYWVALPAVRRIYARLHGASPDEPGPEHPVP